LLTRAVQPLLWLLVFGEVFSHIRAIPTGKVPYLDFIAPGILAQSVLFITTFSGIAVIWEGDLGIIHKFLARPTIVLLLCLVKLLLLVQEARTSFHSYLFVIALLMGVHVNFTCLVSYASLS